jgi:hypothetical protein
MLEINDPGNVIPDVTTASKDCIACDRLQDVKLFNRDSSYKDGRRDMCISCQSSKKMSMVEHTHRLKELNYDSEAVRKQRWGKDQLDYIDPLPRWGRPMQHGELIARIKKITNKLYFTDGGIVGDIAVYRIYGRPVIGDPPRSFEYLMYISKGEMPEFSILEFDARTDAPVREQLRGWRTILLRLIKHKVITQTECDAEFGDARGLASRQWHKQLYCFRNGKNVD